jgi:Uncharacterised nucleotidyltransferase
MSEILPRRLFRWAWPSRSNDALLRAALLTDLESAAVAWRAFEERADFDRLSDGEMRLLGTVSKRLGAFAPDSAMRARILGIQRVNWTRSQIAIGEAGTGVRSLAAAGIEMLMIKGGGRLAADPRSARARMISDIDIVVPPDDLRRAFDILLNDGWLPYDSGTPMYVRARLPAAIGVNMLKGRFGNIDLHRTPFHSPYQSIANDTAIWRRSGHGSLAGANVRVPCPSDAMCIAIAHGAIGAHKNSDWLADIVAAADTASVDWDLFKALVDDHGLHAPAASALRYVSEKLERPVPREVLRSLEATALRNLLRTIGELAETRPKSRVIGVGWFVRLIAKQDRLNRSRRKSRRSLGLRTVRPTVFPHGTADASNHRTEHILALPDGTIGSERTVVFDLTLLVDLPSATRRLEFEINSDRRHHLRLRAWVLNLGRRRRRFRFHFPITLSPDEINLMLVAAPSRRFNTGVPQDLAAIYDPVPFSVVDIKISPLSIANDKTIPRQGRAAV